MYMDPSETTILRSMLEKAISEKEMLQAKLDALFKELKYECGRVCDNTHPYASCPIRRWAEEIKRKYEQAT